jgi:hypothetical protein
LKVLASGWPRFSAYYIVMEARSGPRAPLMEARLSIFQLPDHKGSYGNSKQQARPYLDG